MERGGKKVEQQKGDKLKRKVTEMDKKEQKGGNG